ncbi:mCG116974, partial [Mus musculus]
RGSSGAGIPGINITGVGENPRKRGGFRTAGKRKKTILFGFQNASPEGSPLQKMWTKEGTLKQRWILTLLPEILVPSISGELRWILCPPFPCPCLSCTVHK